MMNRLATNGFGKQMKVSERAELQGRPLRYNFTSIRNFTFCEKKASMNFNVSNRDYLCKYEQKLCKIGEIRQMQT